MMPIRGSRSIRLNTLAPIVLTKYVVRHMMADGGGRIVNVASITAFTGYTGLSVYSATKSSMIGFTRSLAREVGRMGVNVNAVAPGIHGHGNDPEHGSRTPAKSARRSALHRFPGVEDVADAIEYLLGDKAKTLLVRCSPWMPGQRHKSASVCDRTVCDHTKSAALLALWYSLVPAATCHCDQG